MLRFLFIFMSITLSVSVAAQSDQTGFQPNANITDNLTVYMHTGSSRNYRIVGTIQAGTPVTVIDRTGDPEFIQIIDAQGRTGWVEGQYLSSEGSIREQLPNLIEQVASLNQQLSELREQHQQARSQGKALEQQNKRISAELKESQTIAASLQTEVDNADNSAMIEWFTRGGILAVICILLGILLTYLPKKRRRNDQWM
jgi:SH3 domain protein